MIIHIWMHWFWITTAYLKGFVFLTISFACISHPYMPEAGLLDNETYNPFTPIFYDGNNSSQVGDDPNITLPKIVFDEENFPSETTHHQWSSTSPDEETNVEQLATPKFEDNSRTDVGSTSDTEDTYHVGTFDVYQFPIKKVTKHSHLKFGKTKTKGKANEETGGEERRLESVKVFEEKLNINISITGDGVSPEVDKSNDSFYERSTSEIPTSDAPVMITTMLTVKNMTSEEKEFRSETFEKDAKDGSNCTYCFSNKTSEISALPTEDDPKEMEVLKNDTLVIENKVEESRTYTTVEPLAARNRVAAAATSAHNYEVEQSEMNAGSITGITLGILIIFSLFGAVSFVLYRRRYLNKPQVLHDKCSNLDSSGYIDETSLRENSEEMYSLDNDSFLNSLEAMTIQNYWTENVKHTKL